MARDGEPRRSSSPSRPESRPDSRPESIELAVGDPEHGGFAVAPVGPPARQRGLSFAALAVVLVIALAVVKPWAGPGGASTQSGPDVVRPLPAASTTEAAAATPGPTADTAADIAAPLCLGAGAWRIASLELWRERDVRVWRAIEPIAEASGPLDPTIPTAPAVGLEIRALGWCAPAYGPGRPIGPADIQAWIVIDGVAHELELLQVLPWEQTTYLAGIYVPVAPCPIGTTCPRTATRSVPQLWTSGRVVFRYEDLGAGTTAWFGAEAMLSEAVPGSAP